MASSPGPGLNVGVVIRNSFRCHLETIRRCVGQRPALATVDRLLAPTAARSAVPRLAGLLIDGDDQLAAHLAVGLPETGPEALVGSGARGRPCEA